MVHPKLNENGRRAGLRLKRFKRLHQLLISKRGILTAFLGCFILGALASSHPAVAQILELKKERILEDGARLPWVLEADELTYDQQLNQYMARGNVQISKADKKLTADFIRYNHKTRQAFARGNVVLTVGQDILSGSQLDINLENQVGSIENAYLFLKENNFISPPTKLKKPAKKPTASIKPPSPPATGPHRVGKSAAKISRLKKMDPAAPNTLSCGQERCLCCTHPTFAIRPERIGRAVF